MSAPHSQCAWEGLMPHDGKALKRRQEQCEMGWFNAPCGNALTNSLKRHGSVKINRIHENIERKS